MILNSIDVNDELIYRYLSMSSLPGDGNVSLKQQAYVSSLADRGNLPHWASEPGMFFFDERSLKKENDNLAARIADGPWLSGVSGISIFPGSVRPDDLVLVGGNFMEEHFIGLWRQNENFSVIISEDINGKFVWREAFNNFEDLLKTLNI